jgi:hypothetical protein
MTTRSLALCGGNNVIWPTRASKPPDTLRRRHRRLVQELSASARQAPGMESTLGRGGQAEPTSSPPFATPEMHLQIVIACAAGDQSKPGNPAHAHLIRAPVEKFSARISALRARPIPGRQLPLLSRNRRR